MKSFRVKCAWLLVVVLALVLANQGLGQNPTFSGRACDFILLLAERENLPVGVDPEVLRELAELELDTTVPPAGAGLASLESALKPHGFILRKVELSKSLAVSWVTTPAAWAYREATSAMVRGDMRTLLASLRAVDQDRTAVGNRCLMLREALEALLKRNQEMDRLEAAIREGITSFKRAKSDLLLAEAAARSSMSGNNSGAVGMAQDRYSRAVVDAEKSWTTLQEFYARMAEGNEPIAQRYGTAHARGYVTEARFLFEQLYAGSERLHALLGAMQREGMLKNEQNLGKVPERVVVLRKELQRAMEEAATELKLAVAQVDVEPARARKGFAQAYWGDRAALGSAVGLGWADLQANRQSLRLIFKVEDATEQTARLDKLERYLREHEKLGLLLAWVEMKTGEALAGSPQVRAKVGTARGLAVAEGKGELLPVATRIESMPNREAEAESENDYWSSVLMQRLREQDDPVSFGDYGKKDQWMLVAAVEAYRWLRSVDGTFRDRVGLRVDFHQLLGGKAGDSAGVTIAAGGYSAVRNLPLRQDVAMTGSVRSDGAVKAVGGVPLKVAGADGADGVETVIVPKENEGDLLALPLELLCRLVIIVGDDIRTYLKYTAEPGTDKLSTEQKEARQTLQRLRAAQIRLLAGDRAGAQKILVSLAGAPREIYNIRRLLDLLRAQLTMAGNLAEAKTLEREVNAVLTRQALIARAQDFEIPVLNDPVAVALAPPRRHSKSISSVAKADLPPDAGHRPSRNPPLIPSPPVENREIKAVDGLVAHYPFNGDALDASGNENHGEEVGVTFEVVGRGKALRVEGNTSSYVVVKRALALEPVNAITISTWIKGVPGQAAGHGWATLLRKADNCRAGYYLRGGGITGFHLAGPNCCSGNDVISVSFRKFDPNRWQHLVAVYSPQEGKAGCFEDGVLVGETSSRKALGHSGNLYIGGANVAGDDGGFKGLISDFRIYNRALSAMEVRALHMRGPPCR